MRSPVVAAAVALAASGGLLLTPVGARAATPPVQITGVRTPWTGTLHQSAWLPIEIGLRGGTSEFDGTVVVAVNPPQGSGPGCFSTGNGSTICRGGSYFNNGGPAANVEYRQPVVLAPGVTKTVTMTVLPGAATVSVRVEDGGGNSVASLATELDVSASTDHAVVAVVSADPGAFDPLGAVHLPGTGGVSVVHLQSAELPASGAVLASYDLLVIDGASTDTLAPQQRQALSDYVARGGSLLITGGAAARAALAGLPAGLAPVTLQGTATLADLAGWRATFGLPALAGPLVASAVQPHGTVAMREQGLPLLTVAGYGSGHVAFLALDPAVEPLRSWSGTPTLLRQLMVRSGQPSNSNGSVQVTKFGGNSAHALLANENSVLSSAVQTVPGVSLPDPAVLGALLAGYVVVVGPLAYVLLRRLRRRDLLWVTVPVIAGVATFLAYSTGLGASGRGLTLTEVRVLQMSPGSSRAQVDSFATVFSPHGGTHSMQLLGDPIVTSLPGADQSILTVNAGESPEQVDVHTDIATLRGWSGTRSATVPGGIQASLHFNGSILSGSITNQMASDLTDVNIIVGGTSNVDLGSLARGATQQLNVSLPPPGQGFRGYVNQGGCFGCQPPLGSSRADRELYLRNQVFSDVQAVAGMVGGGVPVLVGVATNPLLPGDVQGEGVDQRPIDAVVVPLSVPVDTAKAVTNAAATLVDVDTTSGTTFASPANNTAVYEASLPGGPSAWRFVSASVDTGCYSGKPCVTTWSSGVCSPGVGCGGSSGGGFSIAPAPQTVPLPVPLGIAPMIRVGPTVQVYDLEAQRWVGVATTLSGNLTNFGVPDLRRDMDADGNVWFRIVGGNTGSPGALQITADHAGSNT